MGHPFAQPQEGAASAPTLIQSHPRLDLPVPAQTGSEKHFGMTFWKPGSSWLTSDDKTSNLSVTHSRHRLRSFAQNVFDSLIARWANVDNIKTPMK